MIAKITRKKAKTAIEVVNIISSLCPEKISYFLYAFVDSDLYSSELFIELLDLVSELFYFINVFPMFCEHAVITYSHSYCYHCCYFQVFFLPEEMNWTFTKRRIYKERGTNPKTGSNISSFRESLNIKTRGTFTHISRTSLLSADEFHSCPIGYWRDTYTLHCRIATCSLC